MFAGLPSQLWISWVPYYILTLINEKVFLKSNFYWGRFKSIKYSTFLIFKVGGGALTDWI